MKRFFLWASGLLIAPILLVVTAVVILIAEPSLIVNNANLERLRIYLDTVDIHLQWKNVDVEIRSRSFLRKKLALDIEQLCLKTSTLAIDGCFQKLAVTAEFELKWIGLTIHEVGPLQIVSSQFFMDLTSTLESEEPSSAEGTPWWKRIISKNTQYKSFLVDLKDAKVKLGESLYEGKVYVDDFESITRGGPWKLDLTAHVRERKQELDFQGDLKLLSSGPGLSNSISIEGPVKARIGKDIRFETQLKYKSKSLQEGDYDIGILFLYDKFKVDGNIRGQLVGGGIKGNIIGNAGLPPVLARVGDGGSCAYELNTSGKLDFECPFIFFGDVKNVTSLDLKKFIENTRLKISAHLQTSPDSYTEDISGDIVLDLGQKEQQEVQLSGNFKTELKSVDLDLDQLKKLKLKSFLRVHVPSFEAIEKIMRVTPFAIPAPLNAMSGSFGCVVDGILELDQSKLPVTCTTRLASATQSLNTDLKGEFGFFEVQKDLQFKLAIELALQEIRLTLPRLNVQAPPAFMPDGRIKKTFEVAKKTKLPFLLDLHIFTTQKPILLTTNLAKAQIPIELDIKMMTPEGPEGFIRVRDFPIEVLKRKAVIEHFTFKLSSKSPETIDGRIESTYADFKIHILVTGTVKEAQLRFDSTPALPEEDIISVLLYGRPSRDLNVDQAGSVANTQSAIGDRAIALTSMYLLASTPVESISYDSRAQMFSAKVKLREGTSLDIGTDTDRLKQIGINRHLGGPWYIYTYLKNPTQGEERTTSAFIEWVLKY